MSRQQTALLWTVVAALLLAGGALIALAWLPRPLSGPAWPAAILPSQAPPASSPLSTPSPSPAPTVEALLVSWPEGLPDDLARGIADWLASQPAARVVTGTEQADLQIAFEPANAEDRLLAERFYVPVTRFASFQREADMHLWQTAWFDGSAGGGTRLVVDEETAAALSLLWGEPGEVDVVGDADAVADLLEADPAAVGVVPFDQLLPRLNALAVDGNDPTDNRFDPDTYPLALRLYGRAEDGRSRAAVAGLAEHLAGAGLTSNRDPDKLTVLVMTGVTAMSRVTAQRMEANGYDYPAQVVGSELAAADLTHISNEVPFVAGCQVNITENNIVLCSRPEYLAALRAVGVDLVGLTGNHLNDFGPEASLASIQFYRDEDLPTYGGGASLAEARRPLLVEHRGNRLAFLGANAFGPQVAWAEEDWPGSAPYDPGWMAPAMDAARQELQADLVLVELQWEESYDTVPIQSQIAGFRQLSAAGADIVTGVQSHVPQAVEFGESGLILYGLGNLFFDQMWSLETRQGLIPRHTIYGGRHLSTELLTTMLEDYAQPRWMTDQEREALLARVFQAGDWLASPSTTGDGN